MNHDTLAVEEALSDIFFSQLLEPALFHSGCTLGNFEKRAYETGLPLICQAMDRALEKLGDHLYRFEKDEGSSVHDRKPRTLLTEVGQVTFRRRAYRTREGAQLCLPDEHLAIVPGARIPPGAFEMVRDDALCDSYGRAADLLCRHTKTPLSRRSVGHILKESARIIQEQENRSACDIFINNDVAQDGQRVDELCVEADGTKLVETTFLLKQRLSATLTTGT